MIYKQVFDSTTYFTIQITSQESFILWSLDFCLHRTNSCVINLHNSTSKNLII